MRQAVPRQMGNGAWHEFEASLGVVERAVVAGSIGARTDEHLSWTHSPLDWRGWKRIAAAVDRLRQRAVAERLAAEHRMKRSGEEPIPTTLVLAAFESPRGRDDARFSLEDDRWEVVADSTPRGDVSLSASARREVLAAPVRVDIMLDVCGGPISPTSFAEGREGLTAVEAGHHFEALHRHGWLRHVEERGAAARPGRWNRLYQLNRSLLMDSEEWATIPASTRAIMTAKCLESCFAVAREALETGTFERRPDGHYSCTTIPLDRRGWTALIEMTDTLLRFLLAEQDRAKARLLDSGEEPFIATCILLAFESPGGPRKPPRQLGHLQGRPA